jgi:putative DNA primase/helicase
MGTAKAKVVDLRSGKGIRQAVEDRKAEEAERYGGGGGGEGLPGRFVLDCLRANELGDGLMFAALHKDRLVFNKATKEWLAWNGHHWTRDWSDEASVAVEAVVDRYLAEAVTIGGQIAEAMKADDKGKERELKGIQSDLYKRVQRLRTKRGREACLSFAHTCRDTLAIRGDELDREPWLLACANGVIDLRTGALRPGLPGDYLLRASPTAWEGIDAPAPTWERALSEIYCGNQALIGFLQRLFGYAITGLSTEHILPVFWGQGRNGKTLIVNTAGDVLGVLAGPIQSELILDQGKVGRSSAGPSPDIMALRGLRLALASETDKDRRISPSRVKWLTGGDTLVGRNPHDKYEVAFDPTHTLLLLTNHKPHAPADDFAFWERVVLIPHLRSFVSRRPSADNELPQDKTLPDKLAAEHPGILAWMVRGCLEWQRQGLAPPVEVRDATTEYRRDEDVMGDFFAECCEVGPDYEVGATDLYDAFTSWYEKNVSKRVPAQRRFGQMAVVKFRREKKGGIYKYFGLRLASGPSLTG